MHFNGRQAGLTGAGVSVGIVVKKYIAPDASLTRHFVTEVKAWIVAVAVNSGGGGPAIADGADGKFIGVLGLGGEDGQGAFIHHNDVVACF